MIVHDVTIEAHAGGGRTLAAIVTFETPTPRSFRVHFTFEGAPWPLVPMADPFVIGFLAPAMLLGEDLDIRGPVDPALLATIRENIIPLLRCWFPFLTETRLHAAVPRPAAPAVQPSGCALAFSGGVDALYTAARHRGRIDWLVASRGFDMRTYYDEHWKPMLERIRAAAEVIGLPLILVTTNLREVSHYQAIRMRRGRIDPGYYDLGANGPIGSYLAAFGRAMAPFVSNFLISSGVSYESLFPFGSHPLLDPMWSTPEQQVRLMGCEARRLEKIRYLARECPEALRRLRVCWTPGPGGENCSRCEKCLRTMAELRCNGAQALGETFSWPMDLRALRQLRLDEVHRFLWRQIRDAARERGDAALVRSVNRVLSPCFILREILNRRGKRRRDRRAAQQGWKHVQKKMRPPKHASGRVPTPPEILATLRHPSGAQSVSAISEKDAQTATGSG